MQLFLLAACGAPAIPLGEVGAAPPRSTISGGDAPNAIVDCDGGSDFESISDAIEASASGDLIHVRPCTYDESIDFGGKSLEIVSTDGPDTTIVEARSGAVVRATAGEGAGTKVEGFTLTGGGSDSEAAVSVDFASLRLEDVILSDNGGFSTIYGDSADIELAGVTIEDNRASYDIAIYMSKGSLVASELSLDCNGAATGAYLGHGSALFDRSVISCGRGTATNWQHSVGRILRSTVQGGVTVLAEDDHYDDFVYLTNSVLEGNLTQTYGSSSVRNSVVDGSITYTTVYLSTVVESSVITGGTCALTADTADFTIRNNVFFGNTTNVCGLLTDPVGVNDNLADDPLLQSDWSLAADSPAIDAGPEDEGYEDVDGSRNDIGVYGGPFSIGGGW